MWAEFRKSKEAVRCPEASDRGEAFPRLGLKKQGKGVVTGWERRLGHQRWMERTF